MIDDIKDTLPNHKKETIRKILEKNNYDKLAAMDEILDTPEDEEPESFMNEMDQVKK